MKGFIYIVLFFLFYQNFYAQYYYIPFLDNQGNPGNHNTQTEIQAQYLSSWTLIQGNSSVPVWSPVQTLPFSFELNGDPVTQYKVSTSGILTFETSVVAVPDTFPESLPSANIPDKSVCIWGINGFGSDDGIVTKTFGSAPNREHWIFFPSFTSGPGYTYWSIMLEETTNEIYIVDQRHYNATTGLTLGVQVNDSVACEVHGSPNVLPVSSGWAVSADNNYYQFKNGVQPNYDLIMKSNDMLPYLSLNNAPLSVSGTVSNYGSDTVTSFDVNYSVDGGTVSTQNISGLNIAPYSSYSFIYSNTWTPSVAGSYTMDLYSSNVNGNPDQAPSNDTSTKTFEVLDSFIQRIVLHEVFTSSTCGPCKGGNEILDSILHENYGKWACVKYQNNSPVPGDPYYTEEVSVRKSKYGVTGIPNLRLDGGYDENPSAYMQSDLDLYYNMPSYLNIDANYSLAEQTIDVNISLNPMLDYSSDELALYIAIVESETKNNIATNNETIFYNVLKKMLPDAYGTSIGSLNAGQVVQISESYTFNGDYVLPANALDPIDASVEHSVENFDSLKVLVFVQDTVSLEVHQSAWAKKNATSVKEFIKEDMDFVIYPNPFSSHINLIKLNENDLSYEWEIVDHVGKIIMKGNSYDRQKLINTYQLSAGLYLFKINSESFIYQRKIIKHD